MSLVCRYKGDIVRNGLTDLLEKLVDDTEGDDTSIGELVKQLESRGLGAMLIVPALIGILPTSAVPGVPSLCGITIFLIAIQGVMGDPSPWLPKRLTSITLSRDRFLKGVNYARPFAQRLDKIFKPRLKFMTQQWSKRAIAFACGITGLLMIPLELVPFLAALPALAVLFTAVGITTNDGVVVIAGCTFSAGSIYLVLTQVSI
ncbi:exopolysaccharide biosynthesis protein [Neptunomonas marina]|uniref:Exopolysaccharide biosynthesis protein n=1 Tax=Neptunomonas marina TaxID=1815562 RepID=A0A437Q558_9GAMM|nr:exopolysaccharide biosynthesis protein [Neptunomonas marina]